MQVAERGVIEGGEAVGRHIARTADEQPRFGVRGRGAGGKAVRGEHVQLSRRELRRHLFDGGPHARARAAQRLVAEERAHLGVVEVGQREDLRAAELDRPKGGVEARHDVDAEAREHLRADRDALRPVVVAGNHDGRHLPRVECVEQRVEQRDGLGGGDRPVVEVAGDQHAVRLVPVDGGQKIFEKEVALVLDQAAPVQEPAEMQVRYVQEFQSVHHPWGSGAAVPPAGRVILQFSENRPTALFRKPKSWYNIRERPAKPGTP